MYFETPFKETRQKRYNTAEQQTAFYALSKETTYFKDIFNRWYYRDESKEGRVKNIKTICKEDLYKVDALGLAV